MTPVDQTITVVDHERGVYGNCLQACIATVLDLPLEDVPHFLHDGGGDSRSGDDWWWMRLLRWARDRNLVPVFLAVEIAGVAIAGGRSRSGPWQHCVVWENGAMVHDPNPARLGLDGAPTDFLYFVPVDSPLFTSDRGKVVEEELCPLTREPEVL